MSLSDFNNFFNLNTNTHRPFCVSPTSMDPQTFAYDVTCLSNLTVNTVNGLPYIASGGVQPETLEEVLVLGNDAGGLNIVGVNNLQVATINGAPYIPGGGGGGAAENLTVVLEVGNNAGGLNITNLNNLDVVTINNLPYVASGGAIPENLQEVLLIGNNAHGLNIIGLNDLEVLTINGKAYPPSSAVVGSVTLSQVLADGNDATNQNIVNVNNIQCTSINGAIYNPTGFSQNLQETLAIGGNAGGLSMTSIGAVSCNSFTLNGNQYPSVYPPPWGYVGSTEKFTLPIPTQGFMSGGIVDFTLNLGQGGVYLVACCCQLSSVTGGGFSTCTARVAYGLSKTVLNTSTLIGSTTQSVATAMITYVFTTATGDYLYCGVGGTVNTPGVGVTWSFVAGSSITITRIA